MKNLKKIVLGLMLLLAAFAFVGCPTPEQPAPTPDPEPTPAPVAPVNNFKGNVYVMSYEIFGESQIGGYIEFVDDANGKIGFIEYKANGEETPILEIDEIPFTYSVLDDVATIRLTENDEEITFTTSKLTDNKFTFIADDETYTCIKGEKSYFEVWTLCYNDQNVTEVLLVEFIYTDGLYEGQDYNLDSVNKKIELTELGYIKITVPFKIYDDMGNEVDEDNEMPYLLFMNMVKEFELNENTDYTVDFDLYTIKMTESGMAKIEAAMGGSEEIWIFVGPDGNELELSFSSLEEALDFAAFAELIEVDDYTKDEANKAIILTESGFEKVSQWM